MVHILDCTLRDGGYYNDWTFSDDFVSKYLTLVGSLGISMVELGFKFLKINTHEGPWAYTPNQKIAEFEIPSDLKIGVMINFSDISDIKNAEAFKALFPSGHQVNFVRLACHFSDVAKTKFAISALRELGLQVGVNLMQISERSNSEVEEFFLTMNDYLPDFVYVADSLGSLTPLQVEDLTQLAKRILKAPFGVHFHDNKGMALANTLQALGAGANILDSTMLGMGRGAGNTQTESLLCQLAQQDQMRISDEALAQLFKFISEEMEPLKSKFGWGPSLPYRLAADWSIHPTFVQEMIEDGTAPELLIDKLAKLKTRGASKFDPTLLTNDTEDELPVPSHHELVATESLTKGASGVLIIGPGQTVETNQVALKLFAADRDLKIFTLNYAAAEHFHGDNVFRIFSHASSVKSIGTEHWMSPEEKVITSLIDRPSHSRSLSSVPIRVQSGKFEIREGELTVPNDLTITFALGLASLLGFREIYLAGIEGYSGVDVRNAALVHTLELSSSIGLSRIVSLTKTKLPIQFMSPYFEGVA